MGSLLGYSKTLGRFRTVFFNLWHKISKSFRRKSFSEFHVYDSIKLLNKSCYLEKAQWSSSRGSGDTADERKKGRRNRKEVLKLS